MNHSSEMAEKNNELAKHRYTNMILAIAIAVFCIVSFVIISILRSRFYKKMKSKNEQLTNAMNEVEKSARIRRAMIEDIKEKSNQPQNILRTYSRIIVNPDFNITEEGRQDVLPNIRNSVNILKNLSSSVIHDIDKLYRYRLRYRKVQSGFSVQPLLPFRKPISWCGLRIAYLSEDWFFD